MQLYSQSINLAATSLVFQLKANLQELVKKCSITEPQVDAFKLLLKPKHIVFTVPKDKSK